MFQRKIESELVEWRSRANRKPLILRGARQVGKTTLVDMFSKHFEKYIYINFEEKEYIKIFESTDNFEDLLAAIYLKNNLPKTESQTLIFLDEIQNSSLAISKLRFFYEKHPELFVIAAGSLLETTVDYKSSFPVGRVEYLRMYPLTFDEFLPAIGETEALKALNEIPFPMYAHLQMMKLYNRYALIGGMPEAVKLYSETGDIVKLGYVYDSLMQSYNEDIEKYERSKKITAVLKHCIKAVPLESGKRIKFQNFGNSNYRSREVKESLDILEKAMLVKLVYPVTSTKLPALPDLKKSPKLHFLDTGLINFVSGLQTDIFGMKELSDFYEGRIAEHIVGQELTAQNKFINENLYFWVREKRQSSAEVDYLILFNNKLVPIEVKSGKNGRLRSLHSFIDESGCDLAVRIYSGPLEINNETTLLRNKYILINLPFYLTHKVKCYIDFVNSNREKFIK